MEQTDIDDKNRELAIQAALAMHDQRAEEIVVLDLRTLVDYADYFVIASAASLTRMRGIVKRVEKDLEKLGGRRLNRPEPEAAWILADFGDVIVHIFDAPAREFYQLEDLWGDAPRLDWEQRIIRKEQA